MKTSQLHTEILEQPAALQRLLDSQSENIKKVAAAILKRPPRFLALAARGTSDNAARYGQYIFGARNRLPVALATPSLFTIYQRPPNLVDALVLGISQSGQSPDICAVVEEGRRQGALTLSITNDQASPLAKLAEYSIDLNAGPERAVAATKTYTTSLLALAMLSVALNGGKDQRRLLGRVPAFVAQALQQAEAVVSAAADYRKDNACVVLGRGYNYATAFEIALKLKELTYVLAEPYSSADFQHGPVALVQNGFLVVAVVPEGKPAAELTIFLSWIRQSGAELVVISPKKEALSLARTPVPMSAGIPEWLSPIVAVTPGQLFAFGLAQARGLDPDKPRGLHKVTLTR
jgi:glucosamine--fructose-6-phosphate aminotransferase (isomerizing)